jgi:hypothetical protein
VKNRARATGERNGRMIAVLARKGVMLLGCLAAAVAAFWWIVP